jgi:glycosyltransferase involved in cell wall biosynthesis
LYVLVTPARNEARFIGLTLESVVRQTRRPARWVVVSDGSTDGTDDIVAAYAQANPWIQLLRMPERRERDFAGKVRAFRAGCAALADVPYQFIGALDADISFDEDYFAFLLSRIEANPRLGLVGTPFKDSATYDYRFVSIEHVSGACQLFRRECFEQIGGYKPSALGGVDHIAVLTARMVGWRTRTFTEKICLHHRDMGSALHGAWRAKYRIGVLDYALGGHPLWEAFRTLYQMTRKPYVVGGLLVLAGYVSAALRRIERPISPDLVAFRRREQMQRLRSFLLQRVTAKRDCEAAS